MKNQIMVAALILATLPMVLLGTINYYFESREIQNNIENSNIAIAKSLASQTDMLVNKSFDVLQTLYTSVDFNNVSKVSATNALVRTTNDVEQLKELYIFDNNGNEILSTRNKAEKINVKNQDWFKVAKEGHEGVSGWYKENGDKLAGIMIAMPMKDTLGRKTGIIAAKLDLFDIAKLTINSKVGETGVAYIVDKNGIIIGHPEFKEKVLDKYDVVENNIVGALESIKGNTSSKTYTNDIENTVIGSYTIVPSTGWGVVVEQDESEIKETLADGLKRIIYLVGIVVLISIGFSMIFAGIFTRPLVELVTVANKVKNGDLTETIKITASNEIGELQKAINQMINSLFDIILSVNESVHRVKMTSEDLKESGAITIKASEDIANIIEEVAVGAEKQLMSVDGTSDIVKNMIDIVKNVEDRSKHILTAANQASMIANEGTKNINITKIAMGSIADKVNTSSDQISKLTERTDEIGEIVKFINNISRQTNLLALNAAIEAARAGEHGRGFAVVADEVRKLAEQTSSASKDIVKIIKQLQDEMKLVSKSMEVGKNEVDKGTSIIDDTTKSFENILIETSKVNDVAENFTGIVGGLMTNVEEIEHAISNVSVISQQTAAGTQTVLASTEEQTATITNMNDSTEKLNEMADVLKMIIQGFKID